MRNRYVSIDMLSSGFTDRGETKAYFVVRTENSKFMFSIELDSEGNLTPIIEADLSGNCYSKEQCDWNRQIEWFVSELEEVTLASVLDKAVDIAVKLSKGVSSSVKVPKRDNLKSDVDEFFTFVLSTSYGLVIRPETLTQWTVTTDTKIVCSVAIKSVGFKVYGDVNVLLPRLNVGRNVDIGGVVTYTGLVKTNPVNNYKEVARMLAEALSNEEVSVVDAPYTKEEASVSRRKQAVNVPATMQYTIIHDPRLADDHIGIPESLYMNESAKRVNDIYVCAHVTGSLGLAGWYVTQPMDYPQQTVGMSALALANINAMPKSFCSIQFGSLQLPTSITLRPRAATVPAEEFDEQRMIEEFGEQNEVVSLGHTYALRGAFDMYVDVIDIQPPRLTACVIRDEARSYVPFQVDYSIYPLRKDLDPLAVEYSDDSDFSDEESD